MGDKNRYRELSEKCKKMLENKRKKENERWEKEITEIRKEGQVWEVVNRERVKKRINEGFDMGEWERYFR